MNIIKLKCASSLVALRATRVARRKTDTKNLRLRPYCPGRGHENDYFSSLVHLSQAVTLASRRNIFSVLLSTQVFIFKNGGNNT